VRRSHDALLKLATSANWQHRCEAAEGLARHDDEQSACALLRLLTDDTDTAPIQAAAEALIRRRDEWGARLIFRAITLGDDDASDHLLYFTAASANLGEHTIWVFAERSVNASDAATREGARELLVSVGHPSTTSKEHDR
jgi:HEAT repeat protein